MKSYVVLLFCLHLSVPPAQDPGFVRRIDAEVATINGFSRDRAAPRCDDGEFLRRLMLDLVGYPPTAAETRAFAADAAADKRLTRIDQLLSSERFADFWARRWMEVFFGNYHAPRHSPLRDADPAERDRIMQSFREWLRGRIQKDRPWTETVSDLLEADGPAEGAPALAYKLALHQWPRAPYFEGRAVSHFMGIDLSCVGCHDHPFDRWNVDEGIALAAFSNGRKIERGARGLQVIEGPEPANRPIAGDRGLYENQVKLPKFLWGSGPVQEEVLAKAFARQMVAPKNVQFRNAAANRIWSWLLGRGIVMPVDEFDQKNRPLSARLLNLLASEFAANGHSIKFLVRGICATEAYQRRCDAPTPYTRVDFSRAQIRPLSAEQILNSLEVATLGKPRFDLDEAQKLAERMALGDAPACETTALVPHARAAAWLAESDQIRTLIRDGAVVQAIRAAPDDIGVRVREMYLAALSREPGPAELNRLTAFLKDRGAEGISEAYWALLNTPEFLTRH